AAKLEVRNDAAMSGEQPFERERIHAEAVGGILFLPDHKCWHHIDGILQSAAQKARAMRRRKNQSVAKTQIPHSVPGLAPVRAEAAAGPDLDFVFALYRTRLRAGHGHAQKQSYGSESEKRFSQRDSPRVIRFPATKFGCREDIEKLGK